jgi:general stress protein 26
VWNCGTPIQPERPSNPGHAADAQSAARGCMPEPLDALSAGPKERKPAMTSHDLLLIARDTIDKVRFCFAITTTEHGDANARLIEPGKLSEDWTVRFLTHRRCRKVREIERTGKLTLGYQYDPERAYVTLLGRAALIDDVAIKRAIWRDAMYRWHPGGPEDPSVVMVELVTEQIELWNLARNIMPEPKGFSAAILEREGSGWRVNAT